MHRKCAENELRSYANRDRTGSDLGAKVGSKTMHTFNLPPNETLCYEY